MLCDLEINFEIKLENGLIFHAMFFQLPVILKRVSKNFGGKNLGQREEIFQIEHV